MPVNKHEFWNRKLARWEWFRYSRWAVFNPFAWTVRSRLRMATRLLEPMLCSGTRILDLGCGSGVLLARIRLMEGMNYHGIDLSEKAAEKGIKAFSGLKPAPTFEVADVTRLKLIEADIVVMLGLFDWLEEDELRKILELTQARLIFFSFTIPWAGLSWPFYRVYRFVVDNGSLGYYAKSYKTARIHGICEESGWEIERVVSDWTMGPSRLAWARRKSQQLF